MIIMKWFWRLGAFLEEFLQMISVGLSYFCFLLFPFGVLYFAYHGNYLDTIFCMILTGFFGVLNAHLNAVWRKNHL